MIFYTRDYRYFSAKPGNTALFALLCVLPVALIFILFYSPISHAMSLWSGNIVSSVTNQTVEIMSKDFLPGLGGVHYLSMPGTVPTFTHALVSGIICLVAIMVVSQAQLNYRPFMIYLCIALYVQLFSSIFFIFWPDLFPYLLSDYSQLYMIQMAALLIILPTIFGMALALMRMSVIARVVAVLVQVSVLLIYNLFRYIVYLVFLYYCTSLYMAMLFFSLGVLFDFIQAVSIYGFAARHVSEQYGSRDRRSKWAWS